MLPHTHVLKGEHILLLEDNVTLATFTAQRLRAGGATVHHAETIADAQRIAQHEQIDLALLDLQLPDGSGLDFLATLRAATPELPAIMLTAHASIRSAVTAMRLGAVDYLQKPYQESDLDLAIERALTLDTLRREIRQLRRASSDGKDSPVRGQSAAMQEIWRLVDTVAPTDANVLITGENGTGKEVLARALHAASLRNAGPFIPVNCGGMTETLVEDQLFGHEAHAFTDARALRRGDFELADKGTIFLDEIGEMPLSMQPNLLRVLDSRRFFRIGGEREIQVDVRVISATNRPLPEAVAQGQFRQDLLFRLNVFTLQMPALRERREDIPLLIAAFLRDLGRTLGKPKRRISASAVQLLTAYSWPGNVRQLRNVLERALILCPGQEIAPEHLPPEVIGQADLALTVPDPDTLWERWLDAAPFHDLALDDIKEQIDRFLVLRTLRQMAWNRAQTARVLQINADQLRFRMHKYGLHETMELSHKSRA